MTEAFGLSLLASPVLWVVLALLAPFALAFRTARRDSLRRMRAEWGRPIDKQRRFDRIAQYQQSRLHLSDQHRDTRIDDATWRDLDLNEVFSLIDRTESTLGQQVLYDRLRSERPLSQAIHFDAIATAFGAEPDVREPVQVAVAPLQDPQGYDLLWLCERDAASTPPWLAVFPLLTLGAVLTCAIGVVWYHSATAIAGLIVASGVLQFATRPPIVRLSGLFDSWVRS